MQIEYNKLAALVVMALAAGELVLSRRAEAARKRVAELTKRRKQLDERIARLQQLNTEREKLQCRQRIIDSLLGLELLDTTAPAPRLLDVGSGGGFPALPIAIVRPDWQVVALDSVGKKMRAVAGIATELDLPNFTTLTGRCEELGRDAAQREQYDLVTARALAPWSTLLELTAPFVRVGGSLVLYLGPSADEFDPLLAEEFGLGVTAKRSHTLPSGEARQVWQLTKLTPLDRRFPRGNGVPKKEPLQLL